MLKTATAPGGPQRLAYSFHEAAAILGVSYHSILRLNKRKLLRASVGLRKKLIPHAELERYLAATTEAH